MNEDGLNDLQDNESDDTPTLVVSDKLYDRLRFFALVAMPALMTAYSGVSSALGIPHLEQVLVIATVLNTLLGVLVRQMRKAFESQPEVIDGEVSVIADPDPEAEHDNLHISLSPDAIRDKDRLVVKVNKG